jgi:DNA polymerase III subunit epsilon
MPSLSVPKKLAFVDIETTGLRPTWDRVIEIGILRVEDGKLVKTFQTLINPGGSLPPEIVMITGINPKDLEDAPTFRQIKDELAEILDGCLFIAHNARFDYAFIKNEFKRLGVKFNPKQLCSAKLSRQLFPRRGHHNLDSIIEKFGIECESRHRAFDDAKVIWDFWQCINSQVPEEKLLDCLQKQLKRPSLPSKIAHSVIKDLPSSPGVYIFYGENGMPLYVGKSINIKTRVLSHFASDHSSGTEMKITQTIESIESVTTCGELGALLLESQLVKKLQPLYNRKLRNSHELIAARKYQTDDGYERIKLERLGEIEDQDLPKIMGIYRSQKTAKTALVNLSKEYELCDNLLGLELGKGGCFSYRLGRCQGACIKKENHHKYNLRFWEAFYKTKIRDWPFDGPVVIKEEDPLEEKEDYFLVDKWCVIKSSMKNLEGLESFDVDAYKILNSYLKSNKNIKSISQLSLDSAGHSSGGSDFQSI